jgi:hypothetical protein
MRVAILGRLADIWQWHSSVETGVSREPSPAYG